MLNQYYTPLIVHPEAEQKEKRRQEMLEEEKRNEALLRKKTNEEIDRKYGPERNPAFWNEMGK